MQEMRPSEHYLSAHRLAVREYAKNVSKGLSGYLPSLEGLMKNVDIVSEADLGVVEIPLNKVAGTYSYARSTSFAGNFMPLLQPNTELGGKWTALCKIHLTDGIRDPIKVYEYLNWFYVVEGNKRVSVLKYFDAYSIRGRVTRLIPRYDENNPVISIYYKFIKFYKKTGINSIWFSKEDSFEVLTDYLEKFEPSDLQGVDKYHYFTLSVYLPFRKIYLQLGGGRFPITTGDAFLEYIKLYGMPEEIDKTKLKTRLRKLLTELEHYDRKENLQVTAEPVTKTEKGVASIINTLVKSRKKLKVAFAYAGTIEKSSWALSHETGRLYIEKSLGPQIVTSYIENVPESLDAYEHLKQLAEAGNDIIFATSPAYINAALKTALEYPDIRFFNCSETYPYRHVNTYFGRIYEPRFLAGIIAGSMTDSDILGYTGMHPIPGVMSGINAFALGARMVNPRVKVKVAWINDWNCHGQPTCASTRLIREGADVISHHNTFITHEFSREYGVYTMVCGIDRNNCIPDDYIAVPVWNWGLFYERIIRNILNDTWKPVANIIGAGSKLIDYWWGLDAGIVDILYSEKLPIETQKLVNFMKMSIACHAYHPFTGPIYDQNGTLRVECDDTATHQQILSMDWLVDNVEGDIPIIPAIKKPLFETKVGMIEQDDD